MQALQRAISRPPTRVPSLLGKWCLGFPNNLGSGWGKDPNDTPLTFLGIEPAGFAERVKKPWSFPLGQIGLDQDPPLGQFFPFVRDGGVGLVSGCCGRVLGARGERFGLSWGPFWALVGTVSALVEAVSSSRGEGLRPGALVETVSGSVSSFHYCTPVQQFFHRFDKLIC